MERILVSMETRQGAWEAWSRAISLAKRIDAKVYALLVMPPDPKRSGGHECANAEANVRRRLELLIELAKSDGIHVDYFVSEGNYEEEVIRFIEHNRISLLVAEPPDGDGRHSDRESSAIQKIRHRIKCRMEMVIPRRIHELHSKKV
jgi:K+-sensing histidine kinase KdpD